MEIFLYVNDIVCIKEVSKRRIFSRRVSWVRIKAINSTVKDRVEIVS